MANKHLRKCFILLIIKSLEIKTIRLKFLISLTEHYNHGGASVMKQAFLHIPGTITGYKLEGSFGHVYQNSKIIWNEG